MNTFFSSASFFQEGGIALVRVITGSFLIYHGWEMFDTVAMNSYLDWDIFKSSSGKTMIYTGKVLELIAGILLVIGLFTRIAAVLVIGTLGYIAFFVGNGKVWADAQHPFLFVLLAFIFLFTGGGRYSTDYLLLKK